MKEVLSSIFILVLIYGVTIGYISVVVRGWDPILLFNGPAILVGDWVNKSAINYLGDPHSGNAGLTIPWVFGIRQVYFLTSIAFWGLIGLTGLYLTNKPVRMNYKLQ